MGKFSKIKRTGKKTGKGGKSWYKRKYNALELASKAWSAVKYMKGMINCEKKYHDVTWLSNNFTYNGDILCLSYIGQGDDNNNRAGNSILLRSIYLNGQFISPAGYQRFIRLIIFMDKQNQGIDPTASNVLANMGSVLAPTGPLNIDRAPRYQVLMDLKISLDDAKGLTYQFSRYINLQTHLKFTGPATTDIFTNAIYGIVCSDSTTNVPDMNLAVRLGYYDN